MRVLITGANRGIGLGLASTYAERGHTVFATARNPQSATDLSTLNVDLIQLDVGDTASIEAARRAVVAQTDGLDLLINNAGMQVEDDTLRGFNQKDALRMMQVNAIGPVLMVQAFADLLRNGDNPRIANISTQVGSFAWKQFGGMYHYSASKAALNMYTRALAFDLIGDGIVTVMMHPGWVRTDMGGPSADISVDESVAGLVSFFDALTPEHNARFFRWNGTEHPW